MNQIVSNSERYWSHEDFVEAYKSQKIQVFVNHPAICNLCGSILEHTGDKGITYRSSKLWFWLLPTLSFLSIFVLGKLSILVIMLAVAVSVFGIGANVRQNAYNCIIDASLRELMVFRFLWGNEYLNITQLSNEVE